MTTISESHKKGQDMSIKEMVAEFTQLSDGITSVFKISQGNTTLQAKLLELLFRQAGTPRLTQAQIETIRNQSTQQIKIEVGQKPKVLDMVNLPLFLFGEITQMVLGQTSTLPSATSGSLDARIQRQMIAAQIRSDRKQPSNRLADEAALLMMIEDYNHVRNSHTVSSKRRALYKADPPTHPAFTYSIGYGDEKASTGSALLDSTLQQVRGSLIRNNVRRLHNLRWHLLDTGSDASLPSTTTMLTVVQKAQAEYDRVICGAPRPTRHHNHRARRV